MPSLRVAVSDSVFPDLDPARDVLSKIGAELQLAAEPTPEAIITPHTSFYSEESLVELQMKAAQKVVAVLSGQRPRTP